MKLKLTLIIAFALILAGCSSESGGGKWDDPNPIQPTADLTLTGAEVDANEGLNKFGIEFFNAMALNYDVVFGDMAQDNKDNYSVSPLSASLALAMLANSGDDALTAGALKVLNTTDLQSLNGSCNKIMRYLVGRDNLELANSIWYSSIRCNVLDSYVRNMNSTFYAEINGVDFTDSSVPGKMNAWIRNKTHGYIDNMIESTDERNIIYLINALYFKAKWKDSFKKDRTVKKTFYGTESDSEIDMMRSNGMYEYVKQDRLSAVIKNFEGDAAMAFVLPADGTDIKTLSANLSFDEWKAGIDNARTRNVDLSLPKFNIDTDAGLSELLGAMGLPSAFKNLDKMGAVNIVNGIASLETRQKTMTTVDEEGVTAAAVTVIGGLEEALPAEDKVEYTLDRPFLYFIYNRTSGTILMAGRICNL